MGGETRPESSSSHSPLRPGLSPQHTHGPYGVDSRRFSLEAWLECSNKNGQERSHVGRASPKNERPQDPDLQVLRGGEKLSGLNC